MKHLDRWAVTVRCLRGRALPPLPELPGRLIVARDEPIGEEFLVGVDDPAELAKLLGISKAAAIERLAHEAAR